MMIHKKQTSTVKKLVSVSFWDSFIMNANFKIY